MTPEPLPPLCEAVINFDGQAPIPCNLPADHPGHCEFGSDESMRYQTAALDGLATNGPAQAYTMGYEAGRADALAQQAATAVESATSELEALAAGGYTAAQEARADAIAAVSRIFANDSRISHGIDRGDIADWVIDTARQFATWIEHGDEPKACAPIPCPPFEQANLTVNHAFDWSDVNGQITASCSCGGWTAAGQRGEVNATYRLWVDHADSANQALDAARMAEPRARPTQT